MNLIIPVIFITTALIQLGIFLSAMSLLKSYPHEKSLRYWASSLILSSFSILAIAIGASMLSSLAEGSFFLTLANTMYFGATMLLLFYCRSLSTPITKTYIKTSVGIILLYGILFEIVRNDGTFIDRQIFAAVAQLLIYIAQIFEIFKYKNVEKSKFLKLFKITTSLELIFIILRIFFLVIHDYGNIDSLKDVPVIPLVLLWALLIINIWSYISIHGFWNERMTALSTERHLENSKIKKLLEEKYKLINSLMTANKTALSGALSASISHEINQPLGAIKINSQHLDLLIKTKKEKDLIKNIIKDSDRAAKIISTLKGIFTNKNSTYSTIQFDTFIESLRPFFIEAVKGKNIAFKFNLNSNASVTINPDEISQVLSNIIRNSIEALSKISKKTKIIEIKTQIVRDKLRCSVSDNGPGVHKELIHKIFNLYQSSKKEGAGIGLWLSKHIITKHKGNITLNKSYKKGAEFIIELPIINHA